MLYPVKLSIKRGNIDFLRQKLKGYVASRHALQKMFKKKKENYVGQKLGCPLPLEGRTYWKY